MNFETDQSFKELLKSLIKLNLQLTITLPNIKSEVEPSVYTNKRLQIESRRLRLEQEICLYLFKNSNIQEILERKQKIKDEDPIIHLANASNITKDSFYELSMLNLALVGYFEYIDDDEAKIQALDKAALAQLTSNGIERFNQHAEFLLHDITITAPRIIKILVKDPELDKNLRNEKVLVDFISFWAHFLNQQEEIVTLRRETMLFANNKIRWFEYFCKDFELDVSQPKLSANQIRQILKALAKINLEEMTGNRLLYTNKFMVII
jgi:hypothetical protein